MRLLKFIYDGFLYLQFIMCSIFNIFMHIADLFLTEAQAAHVIHVTTPVTDAKKFILSISEQNNNFLDT